MKAKSWLAVCALLAVAVPADWSVAMQTDSARSELVSANEALSVTLDEGVDTSEMEALARRAEELLEEIETEFGVNHRQTVRALGNFAYLLLELGASEQAENLYRRAFQTSDRIHGASHEMTTMLVRELAHIYDNGDRYSFEGDPSVAIVIYERSLAARESEFGRQSRAVLDGLLGLGRALERDGQVDRAEGAYREALAIGSAISGERSNGRAEILVELAGFLARRDRSEEAEQLFQQALEIRRETLGPDHETTLSSVRRLASFYRSEYRHDEAIPLYRLILETRQRVEGEYGLTTGSAAGTLAGYFDRLGRFDEAMPLYLQELEATIRSEGSIDSFRSLSKALQLADRMIANGRFGDVEPLILQAVEGVFESEDRNRYQLYQSLLRLSELYMRQGRLAEAEGLVRRVIDEADPAGSDTDIPGIDYIDEDHPDRLQAQGILASIYREYGLYDDAVAMLRETIANATIRFSGTDNEMVASLYNRLGRVLRGAGRLEEAEVALQQAVESFREADWGIGARRHPVGLFNDLAALHISSGALDEAEPLLREAFDIVRRNAATSHPLRMATNRIFAKFLLRTQRPGEALSVARMLVEGVRGGERVDAASAASSRDN